MTLLRPIASRTEYLTGPVAAADRMFVFTPNGKQAPKGGKRPLAFFCHGFSGTVNDSLHRPEWAMIATLCTVGFVVIAADFGDPTVGAGPTSSNSWGCSTLTTRMEATRTWAAANIANIDASKVTIFGESMGTCSILAYARDYPTHFAAGVANIAFPDMAWARAHRADGSWLVNSLLAPSIDSAWGLLSTDPTPANADFATLSSIVGKPVTFYYRSDDGTASPAQTVAMAAHMGAPARAVNLGAGKVITDGTTTSGSGVIGSVTGTPALTDIGAGINGAPVPAGATVITVNAGVSWTIGTANNPSFPMTVASTTSAQTLSIGAGHDSACWNFVNVDEMLSWLLPYALN